MTLDKTKNNLPFVSIIIAMRNEEGFIEKCLDSLVSQNYPKDRFEVIILDGLSKDRSPEIIESYSSKFDFIRYSMNDERTATTGWNLGIKKSKGDVLILMSAHAYVEVGFIRKSIEILLRTKADCVGGRVHSIGNGYLQTAISFACNSPFGIGNARYRYSDKGSLVETAAFGSYPRRVFESVGLFNEKLERDGDWEFNYRLRQTGGKIYLAPEIKFYFYARATLLSLFKQQFRTSLWKVRVLKEHPHSILPRHLIPPIFVLCLVAGITLSFFSNLFLYLTLGLIIVYSTTVLIFSTKIALREGVKFLPILPIVFLCLHISYGLGFFAGLARFGLPDLKEIIKSLYSNFSVKVNQTNGL